MLLILWDFDGTLANSEKKFKAIVDGFLRDKISDYVIDQSKFTEEFYYKNCAGKKYTDTFIVLGNHNIIDYSKMTEDDLNGFLDYANKAFKVITPNEINLTKNMDILLNKLENDKDICMLIATSAVKEDFLLKCKAVNNDVINKMDGYSCHELTDDYKHLHFDKFQVKNKPNPAIFIYAYEKMLAKYPNITKAIVIEDSSSGCKAGRNFANDEFIQTQLKDVKVIGYTAGDHHPDGNVLLENGADIVIDSAEKLYEFIESYK